MLQLVRRLAEDDKEGTMALKVLDFLWHLAHQEAVPLDIVDIALDAHKMILHMGCFKDVRLKNDERKNEENQYRSV